MNRPTVRIKLAVVGATALCAAAAQASDVIPGQVLWGDIKTGMTKAEVRALYPKLAVELSPGCAATIKPYYQGKKVASVDLEHSSDSTSTSCSSTMAVSLKAKYGTPRSDRNVTERFDTSCFNKFSCALRDAALAIDPDPNIYWQVMTWFTGETLITLKRDRETDKWSISYQQARRATPDAAAKL
jgi:hypothetical protein